MSCILYPLYQDIDLVSWMYDFSIICLATLYQGINFFIFVVGIVKRKTLVLDLDETLIHSHHDGVIRQTVRPGTPPDFVLKVVIDRHPVRFFVHKRPHVDFFLDIVSKINYLWICLY